MAAENQNQARKEFLLHLNDEFFDAMAREDLSASDKIVLLTLLRRATRSRITFDGIALNPGDVPTSKRSLARMTGLSRRTVFRSLDALQRAGLIKRRTIIGGEAESTFSVVSVKIKTFCERQDLSQTDTTQCKPDTARSVNETPLRGHPDTAPSARLAQNKVIYSDNRQVKESSTATASHSSSSPVLHSGSDPSTVIDYWNSLVESHHAGYRRDRQPNDKTIQAIGNALEAHGLTEVMKRIYRYLMVTAMDKGFDEQYMRGLAGFLASDDFSCGDWNQSLQDGFLISL